MASPRRAAPLVLWTGLVAGTLDITDNLIYNWHRGISPVAVFQYIASGLIGPRALAAGFASVALGVAMHYTIALAWTALFYSASRRLPLLLRRPVICGLAYGAVVYAVMNAAVLPLTRVPALHSVRTLSNRVNGVLAVVLFIGLTVSLLLRAYAPPPSA